MKSLTRACSSVSVTLERSRLLLLLLVVVVTGVCVVSGQ